MGNIFFDLDGTIWDASQSTALAWNSVFQKWEIPYQISDVHIRSVSGKPYMECLDILASKVLVHTDKDTILSDLSVAEKKYMKKLGGKFYQNALTTIKDLAKLHQLFLVSNCNGWYLNAFLEMSGFESVFKECFCYDTFNQNKLRNLQYLLTKYNISDGYYIGDTEGDKLASQTVGLKYVHMTSGFGKDVVSEIAFHTFFELADFFNMVADNK